MKEIFQNIICGRLAQAGELLSEACVWLLGHVEELGEPLIPPLDFKANSFSDKGLHLDNKSLHGARMQLWEEFNTAWLGLFQKQKDMLESGQRIQHTQSLMSLGFIKNMAEDLIEMCDAIQKHGLVDYQYGVEEDLITEGNLFPVFPEE
jgi:hypothetical protein